MVQQVYMVMPPRGNGYRITVEIHDEPIIASRGARTISLDAVWVRREADAFLARNKDYSGLVSYFSGFLKGLNAIGVLDVVDVVEIPREEIPAAAPAPDGSQPLWAAWGGI